jgi:hypothetical protein
MKDDNLTFDGFSGLSSMPQVPRLVRVGVHPLETIAEHARVRGMSVKHAYYQASVGEITVTRICVGPRVIARVVPDDMDWQHTIPAMIDNCDLAAFLQITALEASSLEIPRFVPADEPEERLMLRVDVRSFVEFHANDW